MNKPRKEYLDSRGIPWHRYDSEKCIAPYYLPLDDTFASVKEEMYECISADCNIVEHEYRIVNLPFFSVPMWVSREDDIYSALDFCYCVCFQCNTFISGPAQLCILFLLAKDSNGYYNFNWQVLLQCKCSISNRNYDNLHYFPFLLHVQFLLSNPIEQGWTHFIESLHDNQQSTSCSICDIPIDTTKRSVCSKTVCNYLLKSDRKPQSNMMLLFEVFFKYHIDLVSVLVSPVCHESKCRKRLKVVKHPINTYWSCKKCRCSIYCSENCFNLNKDKHQKCKCYLDILF